MQCHCYLNNNNNNNVLLSCAHQHPERLHDTYYPKYNILYTHRGDCLTGDPEKVDVGWLPILSSGLSEECWPLIPMQSLGPSSKCWPSIASAVSWAFTRVLALDCQCSPLDLYQSAGHWLPVQSPGPSPECWPMISSAVVWFPSWVWMLRMAIIHAPLVRVYSGSFKLQWELEMHLQNSVPVKWSAAYLSLSLDSC